jgi:hypothetical protein
MSVIVIRDERERGQTHGKGVEHAGSKSLVIAGDAFLVIYPNE